MEGDCFVAGDFACGHSCGTEGEVSVFGGVFREASEPLLLFDTACFAVFCDDEMPVDSFFDGGSGDEGEPRFVVAFGIIAENILPELTNFVGGGVKLRVLVKLAFSTESIHYECSGVDGEGFIFFGEFFFVAFGTNE